MKVSQEAWFIAKQSGVLEELQDDLTAMILRESSFADSRILKGKVQAAADIKGIIETRLTPPKPEDKQNGY